MLVLLHECAHQVLGYVDNPPRSLSESRDQEDQADIWAVKRLPRLRYDLSFAFAFFGHAMLTGGGTLENEKHSTHPLGGRRVLHVLDTVIPTLADPSDQRRVREMRDQVAAM